MSTPSASLAIWSGAWLAGAVAPDDVLDALAEWSPMHLLVAADPATAERLDLPWPTPRESGLTDLLRAVRDATPADGGNPGVDLVLPAPGDVAGLPVGTDFATAAVMAGEGVLVGPPDGNGVGFVPTPEGPDVLRWTVFSVRVPRPRRDLSLGDVEFSLRDTVRDAADALAAQHTVANSRVVGDPHTLIAERLAGTQRHRYPPLPQRTTRVLDTADRVAAILEAARTTSPSDAATSTAAAAREDLLRPLLASVRTARRVAVGAAIDEFLGPRR